MALPTCECVKGLPIGEQLAAIYCATYTLAAGDVDGPYLLKSANLSDVADPDVARGNISAAESGANTDLVSITPTGGQFGIFTGSGGDTVSVEFSQMAGVLRVIADLLAFQAPPTEGGNGIIFRSNAGVNRAQLYNITATGTFLDFDTILNVRNGYSGSTVFSVTGMRATLDIPIKLKGYTVGTLPAGSVGDIAYVTDATAPTYLGALVGGGAVTCPVFFNGAAWVSS